VRSFEASGAAPAISAFPGASGVRRRVSKTKYPRGKFRLYTTPMLRESLPPPGAREFRAHSRPRGGERQYFVLRRDGADHETGGPIHLSENACEQARSMSSIERSPSDVSCFDGRKDMRIFGEMAKSTSMITVTAGSLHLDELPRAGDGVEGQDVVAGSVAVQIRHPS